MHLLGMQVKEVGEIKKDPEVALALIKEIEAKEKAHGPTERSTQRKAELQVWKMHTPGTLRIKHLGMK
jgi:hypothetical protein